MTAAERDRHFRVTWNGGPLLPAYDGASTLSTIADAPSAWTLRSRKLQREAKRERIYTAEEKAWALELYLVGQPLSAIARRLKTSPGRISDWIKQRHIRARCGRAERCGVTPIVPAGSAVGAACASSVTGGRTR